MKPSTPLLIGLTGRAGAGKSTVAQMLEDQFAFVEIAFADPLRDMLGALFNAAEIPGSWMSDRALKEQPTRLGCSYRHLVQTLGTEWGRSLSPDFWIRVAEQRLATPHMQCENVVVSDVRFPNEAEWLKARGGVLVRVVRDVDRLVDRQLRTHASEAHTDLLAVTTELLNFGSRSTLGDQVERLIATLRAAPMRVDSYGGSC